MGQRARRERGDDRVARRGDLGTTYTLKVTSAVTGDGVVSFRLTSTSSDGARYFSKEGSSTQQPKLTVTCA